MVLPPPSSEGGFGETDPRRFLSRLPTLTNPEQIPPLAVTRNRKMLVASVSRRERIYKRTGEMSVTFFGEEERRSSLAMFY